MPRLHMHQVSVLPGAGSSHRALAIGWDFSVFKSLILKIVTPTLTGLAFFVGP